LRGACPEAKACPERSRTGGNHVDVGFNLSFQDETFLCSIGARSIAALLNVGCCHIVGLLAMGILLKNVCFIWA